MSHRNRGALELEEAQKHRVQESELRISLSNGSHGVCLYSRVRPHGTDVKALLTRMPKRLRLMRGVALF